MSRGKSYLNLYIIRQTHSDIVLNWSCQCTILDMSSGIIDGIVWMIPSSSYFAMPFKHNCAHYNKWKWFTLSILFFNYIVLCERETHMKTYSVASDLSQLMKYKLPHIILDRAKRQNHGADLARLFFSCNVWRFQMFAKCSYSSLNTSILRFLVYLTWALSHLTQSPEPGKC